MPPRPGLERRDGPRDLANELLVVASILRVHLYSPPRGDRIEQVAGFDGRNLVADLPRGRRCAGGGEQRRGILEPCIEDGPVDTGEPRGTRQTRPLSDEGPATAPGRPVPRRPARGPQAGGRRTVAAKARPRFLVSRDAGAKRLFLGVTFEGERDELLEQGGVGEARGLPQPGIHADGGEAGIEVHLVEEGGTGRGASYEEVHAAHAGAIDGPEGLHRLSSNRPERLLG